MEQGHHAILCRLLQMLIAATYYCLSVTGLVISFVGLIHVDIEYVHTRLV